MFGIGGGEFMVIALVALIAVGPEQLPSVMRKFGNYVAQIRSMADGVRGEFMSGMDEMDPVKWSGDGSDDSPIVPRGFAESATTTLGTPVVKPKTTPMASGDSIDQAFGKTAEANDAAADVSEPDTVGTTAATDTAEPDTAATDTNETDATEPAAGEVAEATDPVEQEPTGQ